MSQDSADLVPVSLRPAVAAAPARRTSRFADQLFASLLVASAWFVLAIVAALVIVLAVAAWPAVKAAGFSALTSADWSPADDHFGVLSFVYGTAVTSAIALMLAGPIGVAVALFLAELAPRRVATPVAMLVELLAAVPSVVYGLWGLFVLAPVMRTVVQPTLGKTLGFLPLFQGPPLGIGMLTAGILLSIMILPTIAAIARDVFTAVPIEQREGMLALGATRWEVLTKAVLPYARSGVIGALVLALGRAMGEAMAVVMIIGNTPAISASLFRPAYTMASVLANEFTEATGQTYVSMLIELGLLLFLLSVVVNVLARALVWSVGSRGGGNR